MTTLQCSKCKAMVITAFSNVTNPDSFICHQCLSHSAGVHITKVQIGSYRDGELFDLKPVDEIPYITISAGGGGYDPRYQYGGGSTSFSDGSEYRTITVRVTEPEPIKPRWTITRRRLLYAIGAILLIVFVTMFAIAYMHYFGVL